MTKQKTRSNLSVQYMPRIAILGALSAVLFPLEIPIVAGYMLDFSSLPALRGAVSMGPLPGLASLLIKDLSRLAYSSSMYVGELADFIMSASLLREVCWEFFNLWSSTETQTLYGREMESLMGASARVATANTAALANLTRPVLDYHARVAQQQ